MSLIIPRTAGYASELIAGIGEYLRQERRWIVQRRDPEQEYQQRVGMFGPDGILAIINGPEMEGAIASFEVPAINLMGPWQGSLFPRISFHAQMAGEMQVQHLYEQGHRCLCAVGSFSRRTFEALLIGAQKKAADLGLSLKTIDLGEISREPYREWHSLLRDKLRRQMLPLGLLTGTSEDAENVAQRCHELGLAVPEQVSIISLNDDQVSESLAFPEFSTVDIPWRKLGYQAAKSLDLMMGQGPDAVPALQRIPPTGITPRRSTQAFVSKDDRLVRALVFIRENANRSLSVEEVAEYSGQSRRGLEKRFASALGRTPFEEIRQQQLTLAKNLLLESDLSLEELVGLTAFSTVSHLSNAFRKAFGTSPGNFRKQFLRT